MAAAKYKLKLLQGETLRKPFTWKAAGAPVDLTGWKARMQIRADVDAPDIIHELTTENGGILIDAPTTGVFVLYISADDTAAFNFDNAVYDLEVIAPNGDVTRLLMGEVTLLREVTR